jgi:hypothetical protein
MAHIKVKATNQTRVVNKWCILGHIFCKTDARKNIVLKQVVSPANKIFQVISVKEKLAKVNKKARVEYTLQTYWQGWQEVWVFESVNSTLNN